MSKDPDSLSWPEWHEPSFLAAICLPCATVGAYIVHRLSVISRAWHIWEIRGLLRSSTPENDFYTAGHRT